MVLHEAHVEWRSPNDALALDVSLIEHVFRSLALQRRDAAAIKSHLANNKRGQQPHDNQAHGDNDCDGDIKYANQQPAFIQSSLLHSPAASTTSPYYHADMLFAKSDVLVALERADGFLHKRPLLRMLHTRLACVSREKEGASVEGFVRYRVKERTLSFAMVHKQLVAIHNRIEESRVLAARTEAFRAHARATSRWCVRNSKSICRSPAQHYNVHAVPVKPKTQKQLDMEQRVREAVAVAVVTNALTLTVEKLVAAVTARTRASSGRRSARSRTPNTADVDASSRKLGTTTRSDPQLRAKARRTRERAATEARCIELRLQIFAPLDIARSSALRSSAAPAPAPTAARQTHLQNAGAADVEASSSDAVSKPLSLRKRQRQRQLLLLATIEANGDVRIAEQLLTQPIARAGFQRALEQATNLELAPDDDWGLVQIWRSVYRSHTIQSLQSAYSTSHT